MGRAGGCLARRWRLASVIVAVVAHSSRAADNGRQDTTALNQARNSEDGKAKDGRTVAEILAEMAKHQDIPTYGSSYVNTFGADRWSAGCFSTTRVCGGS